MGERKRPGQVRDAIIAFFQNHRGVASVAEIRKAVEQQLGEVPRSSVRSYLNLNPKIFERTDRGQYRLRG